MKVDQDLLDSKPSFGKQDLTQNRFSLSTKPETLQTMATNNPASTNSLKLVRKCQTETKRRMSWGIRKQAISEFK